MNNSKKLIYLDSMAHSDISAFLSPSEIKSYIEMRHRTRKTSCDYTQKLSSQVIKEDI